MKNSWDDLFSCYNCGAPNVTGERSCRNCRAPLYYNCRYCGVWVDNTFSNCPNCRNELNWPEAGAFKENAYSTKESASPAVLLLVLSIVLLLITTISLTLNNSNPAKAVSNNSVTTTSQALSTDKVQAVNSSPVHYTYPNTSTANPVPASTSSATQNFTQYETTIIIPMTSPSANGAVSSSPTRSSYLDSVYPGWGRCSGGRCSGLTP